MTRACSAHTVCDGGWAWAAPRRVRSHRAPVSVPAFGRRPQRRGWWPSVGKAGPAYCCAASAAANSTRRSSSVLPSPSPNISASAARTVISATSGHHSRKPSSGPGSSPGGQAAPAAHIDKVVQCVEVIQPVGEVEAHIEEREVGLLQDDLQPQQFADAGGGEWVGVGHGGLASSVPCAGTDVCKVAYPGRTANTWGEYSTNEAACSLETRSGWSGSCRSTLTRRLTRSCSADYGRRAPAPFCRPVPSPGCGCVCR